MKKVFLSLILVCLSVSIFAQSKSLEQKIKDEDVQECVLYKGGEEIQGYIKKMVVYDYETIFPAPWLYQKQIRFIPKDIFEKTEKIKGKMYVSYEPKDCDGYKCDSKEYVSVKYSDMSAVGMSMIPKKIFMQKVLDGKVSIFYHYQEPPVVMTGSAAPYYIECGKEEIVYQIGENGKLKLLNNLNIDKEMADCPYVIDKWSKGEYNKVAGKKVLSVILNDNLNKKVEAILDYNSNCK